MADGSDIVTKKGAETLCGLVLGLLVLGVGIFILLGVQLGFQKLDLASGDVAIIGHSLRTVDGLRAAFSFDRSRLSALTSQNSTLDFVMFLRSSYRWRKFDAGLRPVPYLVPMDTQQSGILLAPVIRNMSETAVAFRATWRVIDPVHFATSVPDAVVDTLETQLELYVGEALPHVSTLDDVQVVPIEQAFGVEIKLVPVHMVG